MQNNEMTNTNQFNSFGRFELVACQAVLEQLTRFITIVERFCRIKSCIISTNGKYGFSGTVRQQNINDLQQIFLGHK